MCYTQSSVDSQAGQYFKNFHIARGNAASIGGGLLTSFLGFYAINSTSRWACGFRVLDALPTANPSTIGNSVWIGQDSGDTNIQAISVDNASSATKVDLGASFPRPTAQSDWYSITLSLAANASSIQYAVTNKATGVSIAGSMTANLPLNTARLIAMRYVDTGPSDSTQCVISLGNLYLETDY
jgi:hypothetical protein